MRFYTSKLPDRRNVRKQIILMLNRARSDMPIVSDLETDRIINEEE